MEQDVALQVKELQGVQRHAGERRPGCERRIGPGLGPVGAHEYHRAGRNPAVRLLERQDVGDLEVITGVLADLRYDGDHHQGPDRVGRRQLVDGRVLGGPVGRRVQLRAQLIGGEFVAGRGEAVLLPGVGLAGLGIDGRGEPRGPEAVPHRDVRPDRVGQVDVAGGFQALFVEAPEAAGCVGRARQSHRSGHSDPSKTAHDGGPPEAADCPAGRRGIKGA